MVFSRSNSMIKRPRAGMQTDWDDADRNDTDDF